jgi:magnesium transporter
VGPTWTNPSPEEGKILSDVFHFHELAVEDALSTTHFPKVESYGEYLYLILHRIVISRAPEHCFRTYDVDFFLGPNYLVTIHTGDSRSIEQISEILRPQLACDERGIGGAHASHRPTRWSTTTGGD